MLTNLKKLSFLGPPYTLPACGIHTIMLMLMNNLANSTNTWQFFLSFSNKSIIAVKNDHYDDLLLKSIHIHPYCVFKFHC